MADAGFLMRLRNDPETVRASRIQAVVDSDAHAVWLRRTLGDPAKRVMIVLHDQVVLAGVYRLDEAGADCVEVSLTVSPEHRGRGFSREIIELAARHAMREGAKEVVADVRPDNVRSIRAFRGAGFMFAGDLGECHAYATRPAAIACRACRWCAVGTPHHTNAAASIGGDEGRRPRYDLHVIEGGGLAECEAGDLWLAWEAAREEAAGLKVSHKAVLP